MSGWPQLLTLAERELEMARGGDIEALPAAIAEREQLAATLGKAPASARPVLERLAAVQDQIVVELTLGRAEIVRELGTLRRGRGAVSGYAFAAGPALGRVNGSA
jgi:hypothetical protein